MSTIHKPWEIDMTIYQSEGELLTGLRHHDAMACTCLLKHFAPRLLRFGRRLVGDEDEAEDILQESLITACAHISDFEGRSGLGTWLHRIVLNTALMHLRRKQPQMLDADPETIAMPDGAETEPDAILLDRELHEAIDHAVLALPVALRIAFVLRDIEGLSTKAAAQALGIGEPALKVRLHRARLALRESLASYVA
jgi:RNA polymerase sigma-70 factor (ECF subfamily)